jgi:hypothetical protein
MSAADQQRGPPAPRRAGGGSPTTTTTHKPGPVYRAGNADRIAPQGVEFRIACLDHLCIYCTCGRSSAGEAGQI